MKEIVIPTANKLAAFTAEKGLDPYLKIIKDEVDSFVPDLTTAKGRKAIASLAAQVRSSKVALDKSGKTLVDELKKQPKLVDAERKRMRDRCDELAIEARKPLTDWEDEQKRVAAEKLAEQEAEKLQLLKESDHEIGLLLRDKYAAEKLEAEAQLERERIANEDRIKEEAADNARQEAEAEIQRLNREKANAELEAARLRKAQEEMAEKVRQDAILADKQAEIRKENERLDRIAAAEKAEADIERAKQAVLDAQAAKEKQEAADKARREADNRNVGTKRREAKEDLMSLLGITESDAKKIVIAIHHNKIANVSIQY